MSSEKGSGRNGEPPPGAEPADEDEVRLTGRRRGAGGAADVDPWMDYAISAGEWAELEEMRRQAEESADQDEAEGE